MLRVDIENPDGTRRCVDAPDDSVIGKAARSEVRLTHWRVGKEHARLFTTPAGILLDDMGTFGGVLLNGQRIHAQAGPLRPSDVIAIGPYKLRITELDSSHGESVRDAPGPSPAEARPAGEGPPAPVETLAEGDADVAMRADDRKRVEFEWRRRIHAALLETMDLRRHDVHGMSDDRLRNETEALIREILDQHDADLPPGLDRDVLCSQVLNEAIGLGPLEPLLADEGVTEIMVNRYDEIYVERAGRLQPHPLTFTGDRAVMGVIERIVAPLGRRIDESSPMVDARLKDGSRVNAIIPPLALKGPCVTIRKFARRKLGVADLVAFGALSPAMADFLEVCVVARKNVIVSGGTGSGKTTLLNVLSNFIPSGERVITVEDAAELKLQHAHLISLEARPSNLEGKGAVPIRDLVRNTLRMRPDRIVVGECRGAEALDMLQAMNTGHEGSLTTLHANSPRDALARLETMVLMAGMELPLVAIREQIASAVDVIVQQTRFGCGSRLVTSVTELTGLEAGKVQLQELFRYEPRGRDPDTGRARGRFTGCDLIPTFYDALRESGKPLDLAIFKSAAD